MSVYRLVEAKGCLPILSYLDGHGATSVYGLVRGLKIGATAVENAIGVLADLGLCETRKSESFPFTKMVSLTPRGRAFLGVRVRDIPSFLWETAP